MAGLVVLRAGRGSAGTAAHIRDRAPGRPRAA